MPDAHQHDAPGRVPAPLRWLRELWLCPVFLYQLTLSRWLGGHCRFTPTCSHYFVEAVRKRGVIVGSAKGVWRILRCHPWGGSGYDPP